MVPQVNSLLVDVPSTTILPHSSPRMPRIFFLISLCAYSKLNCCFFLHPAPFSLGRQARSNVPSEGLLKTPHDLLDRLGR